MIIETMQHLGKCIDDGVELEFQVEKNGNWKTTKIAAIYHGFNASLISCWISYVAEGRIRTKPRTVEVRLLYHGNDINPWEAELFDDDSVKRNCRTSIHTISLDGE